MGLFLIFYFTATKRVIQINWYFFEMSDSIQKEYFKLSKTKGTNIHIFSKEHEEPTASI